MYENMHDLDRKRSSPNSPSKRGRNNSDYEVQRNSINKLDLSNNNSQDAKTKNANPFEIKTKQT